MLTGFDLCRAVLTVEDITAPEQAVLTTLAIMANDEAQCWPPINGPTGLTAKTKLSERAVQRAIQRLKDLGHLSRRQLRHGCVYTIHPVISPTPVTQSGVTETGDTGTGVSQASRPVTVAPKQPVTTKISSEASPPTRSRARGEGGFVCPEGVDPAHWRDLLANRRSKRLTNTPTAYRKLLADLAKYADDEWPPGRIVQHAAERGWGAIFDPRDRRNGGRANGYGGSAASRSGHGRTVDAAIDWIEGR